MANLNTQAQDKNNLSQFEQLKADAARIEAQLNAFQGTFLDLRGKESVENQGILDAQRSDFIAKLQAALGI